MESKRISPGLYEVKAAGWVHHVRKHACGWWEIMRLDLGGSFPYCLHYNKFNTKADAMAALSKRHGYWEARQ